MAKRDWELLGPFNWFNEEALRDEPGIVGILAQDEGRCRLIETRATDCVLTEAAKALGMSELRRTNHGHLAVVICYADEPEKFESAVKDEFVRSFCH